ncbi:S-adenosyl-L-methionine-dependent methyltransferase [Aaosphaeria arxii CBS 175.79]|uniref:S-adenosyl-L-methionine-dependent methyltransferase n=1 Tax=Aaosphaeria arxii CBS 175.79 TaxID=1450172 RepID=A0A6A5XPZ1_9PLEO|nr:S-adenosyl-L-methionine-dependent methyltransferase [Aaosphaeria arxii CBS 175.79]KAF2014414.1 S-adenosyl-L-methionine-dependent methyltransferase [Aaosphaeria arxii CBS 175.79]
MADEFTPKRAELQDARAYAELSSKFTQGIAEKAIDLFFPKAESLVIHDNGCGTGEVTRAILARSSVPSLTIKANDNDPLYVEAYAAAAKSNGWPAETFNMSADALDFEDNTFDISFANFVVFLIPDDGVPALREMHRTLKPGGTAIYTAWQLLPVFEPVQKATLATRGPNGPLLRTLPPIWQSGEFLAGLAAKAGFEKDNVRLETLSNKVPIKDIREFAENTWSRLGRPLTGWLQGDEESWDAAVDAFLEFCEASDSYERLENGEWLIEVRANVVFATK